MMNGFGKPYVAIHPESTFDIQWWMDRGIEIGPTGYAFEVYLNTIRDASGRYDGFYILRCGVGVVIRTSVEAEDIIKWSEDG